MKPVLFKSIFTALVCLPIFAFAGSIKGKIKDSKGAPLPFATVYLKGTTIGTSANAEGEYQLQVAAGAYQLISQYIGFKQQSFNITITGNEIVQHDFVLEEQALLMKEFVVKASEDPAIYIMKKVIKRRSFHLKQVKSFQTDIYLKGVMRNRGIPIRVFGQKVDKSELGVDSNGMGVLYLCEENASYYSQGGKEKTIIRSVRVSGNSYGFGFSTLPSVITFYENNIAFDETISPRGFISPVNDNALFYYNFKLEGEFTESGYTIFKIKVSPKRQFEPLFSGHLYIVDNDWAIHSLNMYATKKSNMELLDTLRIEQVFLPLEKDVWVIKQQVIYPAITFLGFDITGNGVTVYSNQKVNKPMPDSIFKGKIVSEYEKTANKKDTSFWTATRPIPLEEDETRDYVVKDSIHHVLQDPKYIDSMRRKNNKVKTGDFLFSGISYDTKGYKSKFRTNALLSGMVNFNTIEGINIAPKLWWGHLIDTGRTVTGKIALRYGVANTHFNGMARVQHRWQRKDWRGRYYEAGVEGGKYVFQFSPYNPIEDLYNTVATLFYRNNYLKLYERWTGAIFYNQSFGNGFRFNGKLSYQHRIPLLNTTDFSFAKTNAGGFTDNTPDDLKQYDFTEHKAVLAKLGISYQPGFTYTLYPDYKMPHSSDWPVFSLNYEKGIPGFLESVADFDKWKFNIRDNIGLKLLGTLAYSISAGGFLNTKTVNIQDLNHLNGNQFTIVSSYQESFQAAPYYFYSNKEPLFAEAHIEYQLKGFITNKIPFFRKLHWYLVTGTNAFYANENLYHAEVFAGIDNIGYNNFRFMRIDYVYSWNTFQQQTSALRIGFSQNSFLKLNLNDNDGEW